MASQHHKKMSPMQAIKLKCIDCNYDDKSTGTWAMQVESCTCVDCSLWQHRPLTGKTRRLLKEQRLSSLTPAERELFEIRGQIARENLSILRARATPPSSSGTTIN
jgi:hypothetical protein